MARPTIARIYPHRLRHNAERVRALAPASRIMACVKSDGYGHDLKTTCRALHGSVDGFAVASIEEALALREYGAVEPVLLLEGPQSADEIALAAQHALTLSLNEAHQIEWLEKAQLPAPLACWLKVDTGMHRLGFAPEAVGSVLERLKTLARQEDLVVSTHFASADHSGANGVSEQLHCLDQSLAARKLPTSTANSAAILRRPDSHREWVRPGYMLYGGSPFLDASPAELGLQAAMEFSTEVISIRDVPVGDGVGYAARWRASRPSRIATLAVGYGDGYPRHAPDGTPVLIEGSRLPLAGRVSMDMITVDVTDNPAVQIGSRALLWGDNPGVDEIALHAQTIGYELLAGMPRRVPRVSAN